MHPALSLKARSVTAAPTKNRGVQSAVALHLYKGGGLDPLQTVSRVNPAVLGNKSREKLGTLTDSVHAWTVHATTADRP
jgi:hypothetical protein